MNERIMASEKYWNSKKIVNEFSSAQVPSYWESFFEKIVSPECKSVLDLGCGGGRNTYMLAKLGFQVYACDLHTNMVNETQNKILSLDNSIQKKVQIQQADMLFLPFTEGTMDIILSNGVYHNNSSFDSIKKAIKESVRVLKKGGLLCLNIFTDEFIDESLKKQKSEYLYLTPDKLDLMLLPANVISQLFQELSMIPYNDSVLYKSQINVGVRSVMRGIFQKN